MSDIVAFIAIMALPILFTAFVLRRAWTSRNRSSDGDFSSGGAPDSDSDGGGDGGD
jgi:hypothetical protein